MEPLKANPGGQIPINAIIGRDLLISNMWDILGRQSVLMTAERRIGKTQVLRKMNHDAPADRVTVLTDLEKVHTAEDFASSVYKHVAEHLSFWKKQANRAWKALQDLGGKQIGNLITLPEASWKPFLIHCIEDLVNEQEDRQLVFFWDEMPFMLANIRDRQGQAVAMEVLDVLRSLRQEHHNFRMVLTGSIGLHHVISELKREGYSNAPVNDMHTIEVPPLSDDHARELASALILGEELHTTDLPAAAAAVANAADAVPFYIHHIVRYLKTHNHNASPETVESAVVAQMLDANDPWELSHYRDRLRTYYPGEEKVVSAILDTLATSTATSTVDEILRTISSQVEFDDRERLLALLKLMDRDHYLTRMRDGYRIRFNLIARWWRLDRELPEPETRNG